MSANAATLSARLMSTAPMIFATVLIFSNVMPIMGQKNIHQVEKNILNQILGGIYDKEVRPNGANGTGPTIVSTNFYIRSISAIDDYKMEYSMQLTYRQQWLDDRLRFDKIKEYTDLQSGKLRYLTLASSSRIWVPDLFFSNEKQGHIHDLLTPNVYVRIHPDGEVLYSLRVSLTLSCPMLLKRFPFDDQTCSIRMASYGWTTEDLIFKWKKYDPVQVTSNLHLPRFALAQFTTDYCDSQTNTGVYSCLRVDLQFKREFSYYLYQIFVPNFMLVVVSWASFWLDESATTARTLVGLATLLTVSVLTGVINQNLPPVSYTKAVDEWTGTCLAFVWVAFLEFILVNYVSRLSRQCGNVRNQREAATDQVDKEGSYELNRVGDHSAEVDATDGRRECNNLSTRRGTAALKFGRWRSWLPISWSARIDFASRIIFPIAFALFNIVYWNKYLQ